MGVDTGPSNLILSLTNYILTVCIYLLCEPILLTMRQYVTLARSGNLFLRMKKIGTFLYVSYELEELSDIIGCSLATFLYIGSFH